jgi:hypothetical protein
VTLPRRSVFPAVASNFLGTECMVPRHVEDVLVRTFGKNALDVCVSNHNDHRTFSKIENTMEIDCRKLATAFRFRNLEERWARTTWPSVWPGALDF